MLNRGTRGAQGGVEMSIEIDVLNGDASWPTAKPLFDAVWPAETVKKLPWGHIEWAHADLRVLIDAPLGGGVPSGLACHVGIYFRNVTWNGRKVRHRRHRRGVDPRGLPPPRLCQHRAQRRRPDHARPRSAAVRAVVLRAAQFRILPVARLAPVRAARSMPNNPQGRIRFEAMAPFVFDFKRAPRQGTIDLCGLPW